VERRKVDADPLEERENGSKWDRERKHDEAVASGGNRQR